MTQSTRSRLAGSLALTTGALMVIAQLVMWPFDTDDHVATTQNVVFQLAGVLYLISFCLLLLSAITSYRW